MTIELTPIEYALLRGINKSHVQRYCRADNKLAGVDYIKRFGRSYVLVMKRNYRSEIKKANEAKQIIKINV